MLFATFKHHQSDFPLRHNDKFACAKLTLMDPPPFYRWSRPIPRRLESGFGELSDD